VLAGDHYVVNGQKRWIKLGGASDLMTLMVVDAEGGLSRLVLEEIRGRLPELVSEELERFHRGPHFAELDRAHIRAREVRGPELGLAQPSLSARLPDPLPDLTQRRGHRRGTPDSAAHLGHGAAR